MDISKYQTEADIKGDDEDDTALLKQMANDARTYLASLPWRPDIRALYLADGVGGVVAVFLAELDPRANDGEQFLWVIVGDLPSVYLVTDNISTAHAALSEYCEIMNDWANAVKAKQSLQEQFPIPVEATFENANQLISRIKFLQTEILPSIRA